MSGGILLITVTQIEAQSVLETFGRATGQAFERIPGKDKTYYALGSVAGREIFMVQSEMGTATPGGALLTTHKALSELKPAAVVMVGIAFGTKPDKHSLGDILVARQIMQYEAGKVKNRSTFIPRGDRVTASPALLDKFRSAAIDWKGAPVWFGLTVTGEKLVSAEAFRKRLQKLEPEALGGEMEAGGMYVAAQDARVDWIMVKAICDWADSAKHDQAQPLAARNAAEFVLHALQLGGWPGSEKKSAVRKSKVKEIAKSTIGSTPPPQSRAAYFVDRGLIVNQLLELLRSGGQAAVVGVGGMGGVGKTELARHLYEKLTAEGQVVHWVTLADRPLSSVQTELALDLQIDLSNCPDEESRASRLRAAFLRQPAVVILDDARRGFPLDLCLPPAPPCAALVTSRQQDWPLRMFPLDVLEPAQALALLNGAHPDLPAALSREPQAAAELCRLCACHPLALSLAAQRLRRRLTDSAAPLADFNRTLTSRLHGLEIHPTPQDSLRANFDLSYQALAPLSQQRFRYLAVFSLASGFSPGGARFIWDLETDEEARRQIEHFQDASLAFALPGQPGRFGLHDLLREYAHEKLAAAGETAVANQRLAQFIIAFFEENDSPNSEMLVTATAELENLRASAAWALEQREGLWLAKLATTPRNWLYNTFRIMQEWLAWLTGALEIGFKDDGVKANMLKAIGDVQQFRNEQDAALASYEQALVLFRSVGSRLREANVLKAIGDVQHFRNERNAALATYEQALGLFRTVGDRLGEANVLQAIGSVQHFRKEMNAALGSYEQALGLYRAVGERVGEANVLQAIGDVQHFRKDMNAALGSYKQALGLFRAVGDQLGEANVLLAIGDVQHFRKDMNAALVSYEKALGLYRVVGDLLGEANVLKEIGDVQEFRKETNAAMASYEQALGLFRAVGGRLGEANVLQAIGFVQQFRDDQDAALVSYVQALGLFRAVGERVGEANVLQAIGDVQQFRKETNAALGSYEQALGLYQAVGERVGEANVLMEIGNVQQFRAERDAALASYEQALGLFRAVGERVGEANVLAALCRMQVRNGEIAAAERSLAQVAAIRQVVGATYNEGADYGNFAYALLQNGHARLALRYALQAQAIFEKIAEPALLRQVQSIIEACQRALGEEPEA